jgi:hypothetical protein
MTPSRFLNAEQYRTKAAECLEAAKQSRFLDQRRLYEEIAEQWRLVADQKEGDVAGRPGNRAGNE